MPEEKDNFEKTEEPTAKRREEARKKGQVAKSRNLLAAAILLAAALVLWLAGGELRVSLERLFIGFFSLVGERREIVRQDLIALSLDSGLLFLPVFIPLFGGVVLAGVGTGLLQTSFLWTTESLAPDLTRLNPISGLRRLFSPEAAAELVKAVLSVVILGALGVFFIYSDIGGLLSLIGLDVKEIVAYGSREGILLLGAAVGVMGAFGGLDYLFQRWRTEVKLRMSRQELKEEMRQQEGDPLIKSRLRSLRQKLARQRMMVEVARADVVITNPQELAVALRYRLENMAAPQLVGKGAGFIAQKMREVARENGIPLVENKTLARLIYRIVEVGQEIPDSLYRAVAEVLAYVYRLRRGQRIDNG